MGVNINSLIKLKFDGGGLRVKGTFRTCHDKVFFMDTIKLEPITIFNWFNWCFRYICEMEKYHMLMALYAFECQEKVGKALV